MISDFNNNKVTKPVASTALMATIHAKLSEKIDANNTKKYLLKMSKTQIFLYEIIAGKFLRKYNYTLQFPFLGSGIIDLIRSPIFTLVRVANNYRYHQRDKQFYKWAIKQTQSEMTEI